MMHDKTNKCLHVKGLKSFKEINIENIDGALGTSKGDKFSFEIKFSRNILKQQICENEFSRNFSK